MMTQSKTPEYDDMTDRRDQREYRLTVIVAAIGGILVPSLTSLSIVAASVVGAGTIATGLIYLIRSGRRDKADQASKA